MGNHWTCPQGHRWELPADDSTPEGESLACPICGSQVKDPPPLPEAAGPGLGGHVAAALAGSAPAQTALEPCAAVDQQRGGPSAVPAASPPVLPGYEILGELGRGGMGVVYKARHLTLQRLVALKMILAGGHTGAQELARFRTEAEGVARLHHPNIVQIHEVGDQNGLPYFALEFCAGGSLAQQLQGTPLPSEQAARLVETLARAMQAAHRAGIVHRDLKPANILLAVVSCQLSAQKGRCLPH
jgi:hypothetical protein